MARMRGYKKHVNNFGVEKSYKTAIWKTKETKKFILCMRMEVSG